MSHICKLVRDIVPISDGVKKPEVFYVVTDESENRFQSRAMFVSRAEMDSGDKIRWIYVAVAR